jgi:hypothetical protein
MTYKIRCGFHVMWLCQEELQIIYASLFHSVNGKNPLSQHDMEIAKEMLAELEKPPVTSN